MSERTKDKSLSGLLTKENISVSVCISVACQG